MSLDVYLGCKHCGHDVYSANITHNLGSMAREGGFYKAVWRPEEVGIHVAGQLVSTLRDAVALLEAEPARFRKHDAPNGWGLYDNFLPWLRRYLEACEANPEAEVRVSR